MGWFDEQIRERSRSDQEQFEDAIFKMASVVWGRKTSTVYADATAASKLAMDEVLRYFHLKPRDIPDSARDIDDQLEYSMRPYGIMHRNVTLTENWYKDAYGPMLAKLKESDTWVALIPRSFQGYSYQDPETGRVVVIGKANANLFDPEAICFYRPLPSRALDIPQLILYMKSCFSLADIVLLIFLTLCVTLTGMIMPRIAYMLTGMIYKSHNVSLLFSTGVFILCVAISSQMISAVRGLMMNRIETKIRLSVEASVIMRMLSLPAGFFRSYSSGELATRIQSVNNLCSLLVGDVLSIGLTSLTSLLYVTQIFNFAPVLAVPALLIILVTVVFSCTVSLLQVKISKQLMEAEATESGMTYSMINGIQKIKLAGAEKRFFARWARTYVKCADLSYNTPMILRVSGVISQAISLTGTIILYSLAGAAHVEPANYIACNTSFAAVMGAFSSFAGVALSIARIKPILEMADPLLKSIPEASVGKEILSSISGGIELNNVSFRYTDSMPWVVDDMSLKIRPGEYVAIVGPTGCGKSTLIRLLLGFETPQRGAIYYGGKDINTIDMRSLRRKIGVVTQDGSLFQGDIFSNIVISAPQLTLDDAWAAAEIACIADDIRAMPMGMHTIISEGQGGISGGQKQRLMIARAVVAKPKLLMFDEATSALDNITQKQVAQALDNLKATRIVIAHRLSTIQHCDRILVLDHGKIVEDGTYDELLAKNGYFAMLVERQRLDKN